MYNLIQKSSFLPLIASVLSVSCILSLVTHASASELFFGAANKNLALNDRVDVGIFVNTQNEDINAVGADIIYDTSRLQLQGIKDGGSILSLWIDRATEKTPGTINFSGIVPGGYSNSNGYLLTLTFKTINAGETTIRTRNESVLLNDGNGTRSKLTESPISLIIKETGLSAEYKPIIDNSPPEDFYPQIVSDRNINDGKRVLVWNAEDKESGIDHYDIQETYSDSPSENNWIKSDSPYLLKDQSLKSNIFVRAIDRAGLENTAEVKALYKVSFYERYRTLIIIITVLAIAAFAIMLAILKRSKTQNETNKP